MKIICSLFFAFCFLFIAADIFAAESNFYVGLNIVAAEHEGASFSLLSGTTMSIKEGTNTIPNGLVTTSGVLSAGSTIWSNMVSLNSGTDYSIVLLPFLCTTGWQYDTRCFYGGSPGQSCEEVCNQSATGRGGTPGLCDEHDSNNSIYLHFYPGTNAVWQPPNDRCPMGYNSTNNNFYYCYSPQGTIGTSYCSITDPNIAPVCACKGESLSFSFPFTAP